MTGSTASSRFSLASRANRVNPFGKSEGSRVSRVAEGVEGVDEGTSEDGKADDKVVSSTTTGGLGIFRTLSGMPAFVPMIPTLSSRNRESVKNIESTTSEFVNGVPLEFLPRSSLEGLHSTSSGPRDHSCLLSHGMHIYGNNHEPSHEEEQEEHGGHGESEHHTASIPLALLVFANLLAMLAGLCVAAFHKFIVYGGCPLGINGCSESSKKADKAAFLVKAVTDGFDGSFPEDLVYISIAVLGSLLISLIMSFLSINTAFQLRGGGTMQSLIAVAMGRPIAWHCAILRVLVTTIFLSSGGTLGADGPAIQICTCVVGSLGWILGMQAPGVQSILASLGFACGFAASFNSPVAGILFAMEELGHITRAVTREIILLIILASITATAVARSTHGDFQLFYPSWEEEVLSGSDGGSIHKVFGQSMWMLVAVPIGLLCSLVGWFISRGIRTMDLVLNKKLQMRKWISSALTALLSASIGSLCFRATGLRGVWGIGAESMQKGFDDDFHAWEYAVFAICKAMAMILQVGTRSSGDILEPVLIAGGFFGGACGHILELLLSSDPELSAIVGKPCLVFGMVGLFSSCFRFPLTPVVITLELMGPETYALVLPTVLCSFTAVLVSNKLFNPLFDDMLGMDGINLSRLARQAVMEESKEEMQTIQEILDPIVRASFIGNDYLDEGYETADYQDTNGSCDPSVHDRPPSPHDDSLHRPPSRLPSCTPSMTSLTSLAREESLISRRSKESNRSHQSWMPVVSVSRSFFGGLASSLACLGGTQTPSKISVNSMVTEEVVRVLSEKRVSNVLHVAGGKLSVNRCSSLPQSPNRSASSSRSPSVNGSVRSASMTASSPLPGSSPRHNGSRNPSFTEPTRGRPLSPSSLSPEAGRLVINGDRSTFTQQRSPPSPSGTPNNCQPQCSVVDERGVTRLMSDTSTPSGGSDTDIGLVAPEVMVTSAVNTECRRFIPHQPECADSQSHRGSTPSNLIQ